MKSDGNGRELDQSNRLNPWQDSCPVFARLVVLLFRRLWFFRKNNGRKPVKIPAQFDPGEKMIRE
jgi:hypothetical protein